MAAGETLACWQGTDYAGAAPTPRPAVVIEHAAVEVVDPRNAEVEHLDAAAAAGVAEAAVD